MAKRPSLKKAWITSRVIRQVADDIDATPKEVRQALKRLSKAVGNIRSRTKKGKVEYRAADVAACSFTLETMEVMSLDDSALVVSIGWSLTKLFDPESIKQAQRTVTEAFDGMGLNAKTPRDKVWFSSTVFDKVVEELGYIVNKPSKNSTFLQNKLALLKAQAGLEIEGTPTSVTNLRTTKVVSETWLNVQDLVVLGQDEEALVWLSKRLTPDFGPQSVLLMECVAEALLLLYPVDPQPA